MGEGLACIIVCELFIDELFIEECIDELFIDECIACMECIACIGEGLAEGEAATMAAASMTFSMLTERRPPARG